MKDGVLYSVSHLDIKENLVSAAIAQDIEGRVPREVLPFSGISPDVEAMTVKASGIQELTLSRASLEAELSSEKFKELLGHFTGESEFFVVTSTITPCVCWALGNATLPVFQHLLHSTDKNTLFDSHNHLPRSFGWGPFRPSPG